ncbi:MAG: DinB family protein [Chloroflexi bacterium]|nr:DinB family protein [Chloroflexota bacterium]
MVSDQVLREQLLALLRGGNAHMPFDEAVAGFPMEAINLRAPDVSYTPWHLLEHIRRTQWDILEFVRDPKHVSPPWPKGYWPAPDEQTGAAKWEQTLAGFRGDLKALEEIVADPQTDLTGDIPHAPGYNILREALLAADHTAYHIGEFAILRQVMGTWPASRRG